MTDSGATAQSVNVKNQGSCTGCGYRYDPRKCLDYGQVCKACCGKNYYARMYKSHKHTNNQEVQHIKIQNLKRRNSSLAPFTQCHKIT